MNNGAAVDPGIAFIRLVAPVLKHTEESRRGNTHLLEMQVRIHNTGGLYQGYTMWWDVERKAYAMFPTFGFAQYDENAVHVIVNPATFITGVLRNTTEGFVSLVALREVYHRRRPFFQPMNFDSRDRVVLYRVHPNALANAHMRRKRNDAAAIIRRHVTRSVLNPATELGQRRLFREMGLPWSGNDKKRRNVLEGTVLVSSRDLKRRRTTKK